MLFQVVSNFLCVILACVKHGYMERENVTSDVFLFKYFGLVTMVLCVNVEFNSTTCYFPVVSGIGNSICELYLLIYSSFMSSIVFGSIAMHKQLWGCHVQQHCLQEQQHQSPIRNMSWNHCLKYQKYTHMSQLLRTGER
jgi:hypothetical protein